jgi:hypothetical protein
LYLLEKEKACYRKLHIALIYSTAKEWSHRPSERTLHFPGGSAASFPIMGNQWQPQKPFPVEIAPDVSMRHGVLKEPT